MSERGLVELALRLWPQAREDSRVDDPADLDRLLDAIGQPGAPGYEGGLRNTFACFGPDEAAEVVLPSGERSASDAEARFLAHLLVTRTLLAVGLSVDERVVGAMTEAHALSWLTADGYHQTPLSLATSLWLVVLDPLSNSDRPLPIDWSAPCFQEWGWWDAEERLFSHYDVRERALDWSAYISYDRERHAGVSRWTIVEPLLRLEQDTRARLALSQFAAGDDAGERAPAMAMLERNRVAGMLRGYLDGGAAGGNIRAPWSAS
jgi:hypothetical protein